MKLLNVGPSLGGRISLRKQIQNHKKAIKKAKVPVQRLQQCLYTINIGSNDYINNYFMSETYNTSSLFNPSQCAYSLNRLYRTHLKLNPCFVFRKSNNDFSTSILDRKKSLNRLAVEEAMPRSQVVNKLRNGKKPNETPNRICMLFENNSY
ncbi:hypothetical protein YC2023_114341 [Brassica napus]